MVCGGPLATDRAGTDVASLDCLRNHAAQVAQAANPATGLTTFNNHLLIGHSNMTHATVRHETQSRAKNAGGPALYSVLTRHAVTRISTRIAILPSQYPAFQAPAVLYSEQNRRSRSKLSELKGVFGIFMLLHL
jgi:hypothetical protein